MPSDHAPSTAATMTDEQRAVLDAVHDCLCACRQPSGLGLVIPRGGKDAVVLAASLVAQIERNGYRVVLDAGI